MQVQFQTTDVKMIVLFGFKVEANDLISSHSLS